LDITSNIFFVIEISTREQIVWNYTFYYIFPFFIQH